MGNRAVIAFGKESTSLGIYLHWNGGRDSVEAFLQAGKDYGITGNREYTPARLCQIIGNFFGGTLSLGFGTLDSLDCDNNDNGVYVVDDKLNIVDRLHFTASAIHGEQREHDLAEMLKAVKEKNDAHFIERGVAI